MTIMLFKYVLFNIIVLISGLLANGSNNQGGPLIIEGDYADPDGWSWIVSLKYNGSHKCAGNILTEEWVITAAHCITPLTYRWHLSYLTVTAGIYYLDEDEDYIMQVRNVEDFFIHHNFGHPIYDNDVALLKLSSKLNITRYVDAITLPAAGTKLVHGTELQVAGWGETEEYITSDVLRAVSQNYVDQQTCWMNYTRYYPGPACFISDYTLCASDPRYISSPCYGDSGGPLVGECPSTTPVQRERDNLIPRRPCLYGIVSGGPAGCVRENLPAIYANVPVVVPWIMQTINSYNRCYARK